MRHIGLILGLALCGCTTPADVSSPSYASQDRNVRATIRSMPDGFSVDLRYSRYQFVPETTALSIACKAALRARADEEARSRNRAIRAIADDEIRVSFGRNIINARTACRAYAEVHWQG